MEKSNGNSEKNMKMKRCNNAVGGMPKSRFRIFHLPSLNRSPIFSRKYFV